MLGKACCLIWGSGSDRDRKSIFQSNTKMYYSQTAYLNPRLISWYVIFFKQWFCQKWEGIGWYLLLAATYRKHPKKETTLERLSWEAISETILSSHNDYPPVLCEALATGCSQPESAHCHPETASERCLHPQHWFHPLLLGAGMSSNCLKLSELSGAPSPDLCKRELPRSENQHSPRSPGDKVGLRGWILMVRLV